MRRLEGLLVERDVVVHLERFANVASLIVRPFLVVLLGCLDGTYWFQDEVSQEAVRMMSCNSINQVK
jgi:hypothetical protein